jgi:signal transduction histidine kinase/CHASE3 domain sensor protein
MKKIYVQLLFAGTMVMLLGVSYVAYQNLVNYTNEVRLIRHSNEIIKETQLILSTLKDAETGQRGFQLTGDTLYLTPYYAAIKSLPPQFKVLDSLVNDSEQEKNVDTLKILAQNQFLIIANALANVERSGLFMDRYETNLISRGKKNMDAIRSTGRKILAQEEKMYAIRVSSENDYKRITPLTLLIYAMIAILAVVFMFLRNVAALNKSQETERLLSINLERQKFQMALIEERKILLNEAESVAQMGSWKWSERSGEMVWSEGLFRIFGKKLEDHVSFQSFLENVFPEDKPLVEAFLLDVKNLKKGSRIDFRIMRSDQLRYVSITAKPQEIVQLKETAIVGAVIDVTDSKVNEKQLQQYNAELKRSNEDLEQFAYVASHDLQEPLRKIRAFGDRLSSKFSDRLEDQGSDYVARMQAAAARMQLLIEDLLSFSRVSRADADFELIPIRSLLNEVLEDIDLQVSQHAATIRIGDIPDFYGDPSQIKRLFQNLVGNAVKFHKENERPVIDVSSRLLERVEAERETGAPLPETQFVRISIKDNGIGFDEKYVEKIFNIFQRLNGRTAYEGTGIGLAICRKIVTNHRGYITAKSIEDVGSEFIVILPKDLTTPA